MSVGSKNRPASPTTSGSEPARLLRDRRAAGHRLDGREAETFHQRGLHQGVGPAVEVSEVGVGHEPGEVGSRTQARTGRPPRVSSGTWV